MTDSDKMRTRLFENLTARCVKWAGGSQALEIVLAFFVLWLIAGPFMGFSSGWQMIMGTVSASVTLVMVFLLVRAQAKDTMAMQMKLNEVIAAMKGANNQLISIENLSETALQQLSKRYETVATKLMSDDAVSTEAISSHEISAEEDRQKGD